MSTDVLALDIRACIEAFSEPGDVVLDPYMGGGTTVLEAMVLGRQAIGSDINSLSVFIARAKTSPLTRNEMGALAQWAAQVVTTVRCHDSNVGGSPMEERVPRNMTMPEARWLKKTISQCLGSTYIYLPTLRSRAFARCVLLNVGQWALNGKRRIPSASEFRDRVVIATTEMIAGVAEFSSVRANASASVSQPILRQGDAEHIERDSKIQEVGPVDLVVTSPPYPGIHILYHRWQVDARKETDAPYWIAACTDGSGAAYYNFADRKLGAIDKYFEKAALSFGAVRRLMRSGAVLAQMIAFSEPIHQFRRYLKVMEQAGFEEIRATRARRIWREVPSRRWHATFKGELESSKEVVLLHRAV